VSGGRHRKNQANTLSLNFTQPSQPQGGQNKLHWSVVSNQGREPAAWPSIPRPRQRQDSYASKILTRHSRVSSPTLRTPHLMSHYPSMVQKPRAEALTLLRLPQGRRLRPLGIGIRESECVVGASSQQSRAWLCPSVHGRGLTFSGLGRDLK
jgi:hypothetical protein